MYCLRALGSRDRGSNPIQGMDVWYVHVFILFVLPWVYVEDLRGADHPSKESYHLQNDQNGKSNLHTVKV
jgi:hypothetical protein